MFILYRMNIYFNKFEYLFLCFFVKLSSYSNGVKYLFYFQNKALSGLYIQKGLNRLKYNLLLGLIKAQLKN